MRGRGPGWQGSDADEMDDAGLGCHAKGTLTVRGSATGRDFRHLIAGGDRQGPSLGADGLGVGHHGGQVKRRGPGRFR